eukprot:10508265-Alexandrium_andersonii.AAC.1
MRQSRGHHARELARGRDLGCSLSSPDSGSAQTVQQNRAPAPQTVMKGRPVGRHALLPRPCRSDMKVRRGGDPAALWSWIQISVWCLGFQETRPGAIRPSRIAFGDMARTVLRSG